MATTFGILSERYNSVASDIAREVADELPLFVNKEKFKNKIFSIVMEELNGHDGILHIMDPVNNECSPHKWKDYKWILEYVVKRVKSPSGAYEDIMEYSIIEPYVCVKCGKRKDIKLETGKISLANRTLENVILAFNEAYPEIKPKAEVENAINDDINVDREYLKWDDFLHKGGESPSDGAKLELKL